MAAPLPRAAVLYHYPCPDGAFAALAAHLYFAAEAAHSAAQQGPARRVQFVPNRVFRPVRADDARLAEAQVVYLLDFAGPQGFPLDVAARGKHVVVLDHHKTAAEQLAHDLEAAGGRVHLHALEAPSAPGPVTDASSDSQEAAPPNKRAWGLRHVPLPGRCFCCESEGGSAACCLSLPGACAGGGGAGFCGQVSILNARMPSLPDLAANGHAAEGAASAAEERGGGEDPGSSAGVVECHIDLSRSGATVSLDFFAAKLQDLPCAAGATSTYGAQKSSVKDRAEQGAAQREARRVALCERGLQALKGGHSSQHEAAEALVALFRHIEDGDLWRWALPGSKEVSAGFGASGIELDAEVNASVWDQLVALSAPQLKEAGARALAQQEQLIAAALASAFPISIGGPAGQRGQCLAVLCEDPVLARLRSQLGNALAAKSRDAGLRAMGAVVYDEPELKEQRKVKVSLRSIGPDEDTAAIAQVFGGGGHLNASSFLLPEAEFQQWRQ